MIKITSTNDVPVQFDFIVTGVAVYLDNFAILELAKDHPDGRRQRFLEALAGSNGSLLFSGVNGVELAALKGDSALRVRKFLNEFGVRWVFVEQNPIKVMARESEGKTADACLAPAMLHAFFQDRKTELLNSTTVLDMSAESFCQLGAVVDWMGLRRDQMIENGRALDKAIIEMVDRFRAEYEKSSKLFDRRLPEIVFDDQHPASYVWNNVVRSIVVGLKGQRLKKGDGRDLCHAVIGAAYGSLTALDKHWKKRIEALPKPNRVAKVYYAPELDQLVADLEAHASGISARRVCS